MRVFGCAWKINFSKIIFKWPCVFKALTQKWFEVKIFTSNHFQTHAQRQRKRKRERGRRESPVLRPSSSPTTTDRADRAAPIIAPHLAPRWSQQRSHRTDRSTAHFSLPSSLNLTGFDEFFFWVLFLLCFCIEEWYYIFVWQLRKCDQQAENVFSMVFSRTQPNTRKYFSKHFLKCN